MKDLRRLLLLGLLLAGTASCDRATKHYAMTTLTGAPDQSFFSDTVRLTYHENPGAFLGVGAQWRPELRATFFQFGNGLFLLATAVLALRSRFSRLGQAGLALFLAGGVSNLVDRVAMGRVIDFLNVGIGPLRTGVFNVADMAIIAGVAILIAEGVRNTYTPAVTNLQA
ncbi:MAG: signal peptidase II [Acidobacteriota bacterium]|nr:signal peptidase II [Acidobacteriota bacterium]